MLLTTSYEPTQELVARTQRLAAEFKCRWVPRKRMSVSQLRKSYKEQGIVIGTEREIVYYPEAGGHSIFFHPSTAMIRIKRLQKGETDTLVEQIGLEPGHSILDCTAGLASDSIVFSYVVGETGQVITLESEAIVYLLLKEGLAKYTSELEVLDQAMRRIRLTREDHLTYMQKLEDQSMDYIYFDPMFRSPIEESSSISPLREIANSHPISAASIAEARRVARKKIILKEHRDSTEFARLGFVKQQRAHTKIAYGVIEL
jgi:16S rRNA (guanine1516-N2)-methyltransferase